MNIKMNVLVGLYGLAAELTQIDIEGTLYSGRGMYGATTIGFVGYQSDWDRMLLNASRTLDEEEIEILGSMMENLCRDQMGKSEVFYFSDVTSTHEDILLLLADSGVEI